MGSDQVGDHGMQFILRDSGQREVARLCPTNHEAGALKKLPTIFKIYYLLSF
jgi:hypothetical protein